MFHFTHISILQKEEVFSAPSMKTRYCVRISCEMCSNIVKKMAADFFSVFELFDTFPDPGYSPLVFFFPSKGNIFPFIFHVQPELLHHL